MKNQNGFTLIELVVVIVILGILAAVAVPKFVDLRKDARVASLNGLAGGVRSAASMTKAKFIVGGDDTASSVIIAGTTSVDVVTGSGNGQPEATATGIVTAMESYEGFSPSYDATAGTATFTPDGVAAGSACSVTYTQSTGLVSVSITDC